MTPADIARLQLPRDLPRLREAVTSTAASAAAGRSEALAALLQALAAHHPLALADLVVGARAIGGAPVARAALTALDALEGVLAPAALYRRLIHLAEAARTEVLAEAVRRHPAAAWLVPLSMAVEGEQAGYIHLVLAPEDALEDLCTQYVEAGCAQGLAEAGAQRHSLLPARVLLVGGNLSGAALAALAYLDIEPEAPAVEALAAVWGPDLHPWLEALIAAARHPDDLARLAPYTAWYPALETRRRSRESLLPPPDGRD